MVVHPESIVHGMVQLIDGALLAYMACPDMRIPIAFALNGGQRKSTPFGQGKPCRVRKAHVSCARRRAVPRAQTRL